MLPKLKRSRVLLLPLLITALLLLAACSGQAAMEPAAPASSAGSEMAEEAQDDQMADDMAGEESGEDMSGEHSEDMDMEEDESMDDGNTGMSDDSMAEESMSDESMTEESMDHESMDDESMGMESDSEMHSEAMERPSWQEIELTDARTGDTFTLADYDGKTVYVEPFATWCSNCRRQLGNVQSAHTELGDDAVFIALSVEPNIAAETLIDYAEKQGFEFGFAAMPVEMLQQLSDEYGQTIGNPPSTPHFIIWPDGSTTDLVTGFEDASDIVAQIQSAGS